MVVTEEMLDAIAATSILETVPVLPEMERELVGIEGTDGRALWASLRAAFDTLYYGILFPA